MKKKITVLTAGVLCFASLVTGAVAKDVIQEITAQLRPDFTIKVDGEKINFKNVEGEEVQPVLFEGTTYLPIRAIGELMGKTVYWYEKDKLIELKTPDETTVTDADVIVDGSAKNNKGNKKDKNEKPDKPQKETVDKSGFIGEEKAKEIALEKAGLSADEVKFDRVELDKDNGVWEYEVEFRKDRTEYDADINAEDGSIIKWETDTDDIW